MSDLAIQIAIFAGIMAVISLHALLLPCLFINVTSLRLVLALS